MDRGRTADGGCGNGPLRLAEPNIVGHDIGGAIALRRVVLDQQRFRRLALCDPVAIAPWITPFSRHVQRHLEAFQTVPEHIHREMAAAHIRTAVARDLTDEELQPYLRPWLGSTGQAAYYRQVAQFDERYTGEIEPRYGEIRIPTTILWGEHDTWCSVDASQVPSRALSSSSSPTPDTSSPKTNRTPSPPR